MPHLLGTLALHAISLAHALFGAAALEGRPGGSDHAAPLG